MKFRLIDTNNVEMNFIQPVYVSTKSESGFATPIAYESCTSARFERPLFTTDFAICRQMYAAERSTFVGSLPENAPPPCAPHPP